MLFGDHFITPYRCINDVLLPLRNLRDRWRRRKIPSPLLVTKRDVELTILVGDMAALDGNRLREISAVVGSVQVLGFRFGQSVDFPRGAFEVSEIEGCLFPEFHGVLAGALTRIAGLRLAVLASDLPGLGLFLDPTSDSWKSYLAGFIDQVPRREAPGRGERRSLPAARQFADVFAEFYLRTRILE
jgi:hypothetical protein